MSRPVSARRINGVNVGCFLTPNTRQYDYTWPPSLKQEIDSLVGEYPVDVKGFRTENKDWLHDQIYAMTRKHFEVIRYLSHLPNELAQLTA